MNELERRARSIASKKIALIKDPLGENLPDDLWRQAIPLAELEIEREQGDIYYEVLLRNETQHKTIYLSDENEEAARQRATKLIGKAWIVVSSRRWTF